MILARKENISGSLTDLDITRSKVPGNFLIIYEPIELKIEPLIANTTSMVFYSAVKLINAELDVHWPR